MWPLFGKRRDTMAKACDCGDEALSPMTWGNSLNSCATHSFSKRALSPVINYCQLFNRMIRNNDRD